MATGIRLDCGWHPGLVVNCRLKTKTEERVKIITSFQTLALLLCGLVVPLVGHGQIYSYSGPITGGFEMFLSDANGPGSGQNPNNYLCGNFCQFRTLTETICLDTVAHTIRQMGFISVSPSTATRTVDDSRLVGGVLIPATLTLNLSVTGGGVSFDTGPLNYHFDPGFNNVISGREGIPPIAFNGSYLWTTDGQTYSDSFDYQLIFGLELYHYFSITDPTSLTLSGPQEGGTIGKTVAGTTAANGFILSLVTGGSDYASHAYWTGDITATTIPEPGCVSLFGLGLSVLVFSRYRNRT
jgi:hypothetical protein